jgi:hypothetical protein
VLFQKWPWLAVFVAVTIYETKYITMLSLEDSRAISQILSIDPALFHARISRGFHWLKAAEMKQVIQYFNFKYRIRVATSGSKTQLVRLDWLIT